MLLLAAQIIRLCLALWVGGTLVVVMAAPVLFRRIPSRDLAGEIFGELLRRFEAVKHVLSLALVIAGVLALGTIGFMVKDYANFWAGLAGGLVGLAAGYTAARAGP